MKVMTKGRLPGIYFLDEAPPLAEALPRMDIAAFVGLAASGPLNIPVPVEDVGRFRDIYGGDLPLAWDASQSQMQHAHLAPVVEAFFRNGGRRCWVVRVARDAESHRFPLPGLLRLGDDEWLPALARARCEGSWSDTLSASTMRHSQSLGAVEFGSDPQDPETYIVDFALATSQVQSGDLLQLNFGLDGALLFLIVDSVEAVPPATTAGGVQLVQRARGKGHWFLRRYQASPPLEPKENAILCAACPESSRSLKLHKVRQATGTTPFYAVELDEALADAPSPGDLLRIDFEGGQCLLLSVAEVEAIDDGRVRVRAAEGLWPVTDSEGLAQAWAWQTQGSPPQPRQPAAERLALELIVWNGEQMHTRLGRLAFCENHPRFWANLPVDEELFQLRDGHVVRPAPGSLQEEASEPRFPLAGPEGEKNSSSSSPSKALYVPLGMPTVPDPLAAKGPLDPVESDTGLRRDGLLSFDADLFLDADLAAVGSGALLAEAHHKLYIRRQPLLGVHSLLPIEEVTLLAVPDAVHRGWQEAQAPLLSLLPAPDLHQVSQYGNAETHAISWSLVVDATAYALEEANEPTFAQPVTHYVEASFQLVNRSLKNLKALGIPDDLLLKLESIKDQITISAREFLAVLERTIGVQQTNDFGSAILDEAREHKMVAVPILDRGECPKLVFYRVRALSGNQVSPWSNTEGALIPEADFDDCQDASLAPPHLQLNPAASPPDTDYVLDWDDVDGATGYILQQATDPAFDTGTVVYSGSAATASVKRRTSGIYYYRVRAERKELSAWSDACAVRSGQVLPWSGDEPCSALPSGQTATLRTPAWEPITANPSVEGYELRWSYVPRATAYVLQRSIDPTFESAITVYSGPATSLRVRRREEGLFYYRVRATRHALGPWSNTEWLVVQDPRQQWTVRAPTGYDNGDLLAVQRALLRFCAARGDLVALLSLPNHYREDEALSHLAALTPHVGGSTEKHTSSGPSRVMPLTLGEERVLSFGALYHPWVLMGAATAGSTTVAQRMPPDGAICGMIAARAIARGAWVAPANEPLRSVVALEPIIGRQGQESLYEAQINLIRQDPRGFMPLSADTLSLEDSVRPINVRRLLILLRRLALREGMTYVFQPNDASFRRRVQLKFEQILTELYTRGAFAGDTPASAFQVVADSSVNTPASLDQGRFIVELRVAPSQPMAFLTVRLVQTDQDGLTIQEV